MQNNIKANQIEAVDVYLERRKTRQYVGRLYRESGNFVFEYDHAYIYNRRALTIGPDLPLSTKRVVSKKLFTSFEDRIPSKKNPAYNEYCKAVGIEPTEKDLLVLVGTLGQRGPSSFIFTPVFKNGFDGKMLAEFRSQLGLSTREFSDIFDFSPATISKIETNKSKGKDALKRLEIYFRFPQVALFEVKKNSFKINDKKREVLQNVLERLARASAEVSEGSAK